MTPTRITGNRWGVVLAPLLLLALVPAPGGCQALADSAVDPIDGRQLMNQVHERHNQYPYVFEELSMVLVDRNGQRETRRMNRYSRVAGDESVQILLQFTFPLEVQGVALLASMHADGSAERQVFLPALGQYLINNGRHADDPTIASDDNFLGTDFSIENLIGEDLTQFHFVRQRDIRLDGSDYFVVAVHSRSSNPETSTPLRHHYIMKEAMFITRTDHFDGTGRLVKQQTYHDLTPLNGNTWRANMILMDNLVQSHQTIIKIDRRILSSDYVPDTVFTPQWIFANVPAPEVADPETDAYPLPQFLPETESVPLTGDAGETDA